MEQQDMGVAHFAFLQTLKKRNGRTPGIYSQENCRIIAMTWTQIVKVHSFFMSNILGSLSMVRNALDPLKLINDHVYHSGLLVWNAMKIDYLLLLARKSAILPIYLHTIRLILRKRSSVSIDSRNASFFHCNCNQGRGVLSLDNRAITEV